MSYCALREGGSSWQASLRNGMEPALLDDGMELVLLGG